jgi:hypothetical protein
MTADQADPNQKPQGAPENAIEGAGLGKACSIRRHLFSPLD